MPGRCFAHIRQPGVPCREVLEPSPGARIFIVRDPDGNLLAFVTR